LLVHVTPSWTAATLPNADWASVVYGNGKFVAVAKGSATTAYSTDGVTWTTGNSGVSSGAFKVIYGNGKFVAVNQQTSNNLFYSTDGITWTAGSINSGSSAWTSVIFANGKFVAIGVAASANAAYSTYGVTWKVVITVEVVLLLVIKPTNLPLPKAIPAESALLRL
jgi:hypothetical protein